MTHCALRAGIEPKRVIDQMAQHVHHPAGGRAINGIEPPQRAADDDVMHFSVMLAITMLMAHDGLDFGRVKHLL